MAPARLKMYCRDLYDLSPGPSCADTPRRSTASSKAKQLAALVLSPYPPPPEYLPPILLELPIPVVEGADLAGLEPSRDAVEVEGVLRNR